jgi:phosphomevalonate kinase
MTKTHKDSISEKLAKKLNERKKWHTVKDAKRKLDKKFKAFWNKRMKQPETKPEPEETEEQRKLRKIARRIHNEDYPPPELGVDLWNTSEREKQQDS